jgi:hypothetical protein
MTELFQKKAPNPDYQPPEAPKDTDPLSVHNYYMSMSDYHDRQSSKHARLKGLKRLYSQDRAYHDDRSLFHKGMRDGWAQKALGIDLVSSGSGSGIKMREDCLDPPDTLLLDGRCATCGDRLEEGRYCEIHSDVGHSYRADTDDDLKLQHHGFTFAARHGKTQHYDHPEGHSAWTRPDGSWEVLSRHGSTSSSALNHDLGHELNQLASSKRSSTEAFAGSRPTGALNTVNQNKPQSPKVLTTPQRVNVQKGVKPAATVKPRIPTEAVHQAIQSVAEGDDPMLVICGVSEARRTNPGFDLEALKTSHPKTFKHLLNQSREAELNTGDPAGESGTYHHIAGLPPSKRKTELDHSLVHHVATHLGPDMSYDLTGRLTAKVRRDVPGGDILGAFESGKLASHVEPLIIGPTSDKYRHEGDKYW